MKRWRCLFSKVKLVMRNSNGFRSPLSTNPVVCLFDANFSYYFIVSYDDISLKHDLSNLSAFHCISYYASFVNMMLVKPRKKLCKFFELLLILLYNNQRRIKRSAFRFFSGVVLCGIHAQDSSLQ